MESGLFMIYISLILVGDQQWSVFRILDLELDGGQLGSVCNSPKNQFFFFLNNKFEVF